MYLERLRINSFRNIRNVDEIILPKEGILVAVAPNAFGKTNFLESVAVLLRGKSFRAKIKNCVSWGASGFVLAGSVVRSGGEEIEVLVRYQATTKKMRIEEGGEIASLVSFYSRYPYVLFVPEDTTLFSRGPTGRRNFLNQTLVTHQSYLSALVQYHRVLRHRNMVLKQRLDDDIITTWTDLLLDHAQIIWDYRDQLAHFLNTHIAKLYTALSGEDTSFTVALEKGSQDPQNYKEELIRDKPLEERYGYTLHGPHRDDLIVATKDGAAGVVLSRGQVRSVVLALKILSHRYVEKLTNEEPLLLLDDVFSELDDDRQAALFECLPKAQTILTCTSIPQTLQDRGDVYRLDLQSILSNKESVVGTKNTALVVT